MFELGDHAEKEHQEITSFLDEHHFGRSYLIGENFFKTSTKDQNFKQFKNFEDLKDHLKSRSFENSTILIKASRGMALERILELL